MKKSLIKILSGLAFLIFTCPFFQTCSNETIRSNPLAKRDANMASWSSNAYELSSLRHITEPDMFIWPEIFFTIIIFASIAIFVLGLGGHYSGLRFLCYLNLLLAFLYLVAMFFCLVLEDIRQVKYGYYLFLINTLAIVLLSKKLEKEKNDF